MNKSTGNFRKCIIALTGLLIAFSLNAQTINEVIQTFNAGAGEMNAGNYESALAGFETTVALATALGAEGDEMKAKAEAQIPTVHYRIALEKYKAKDIEGAIVSFENAIETGEQYGNADAKSRSLRYVPQLHNAVGNSKVQAGDYDAAVASYDRAIEYNPAYARAYYGKAVAYMKQDNDEAMVSTMEKAIEVGTAAADTTTAAAAAKILRDHFVNAGKALYQAKNYEEALVSFESSLKYDTEYAESYYLISLIHGINKAYEETVQYGLKALEYEEDDATKKARIYYELGMAYIALAQNDKACDALGRALVEPYAESARHNMDNVLKCGQ
jgi:tetratricopeptide (TPR) repeat protein